MSGSEFAQVEASIRTKRPSGRSLIESWLDSAHMISVHSSICETEWVIRTVTEALVPNAKTSPVRITDFPP